jgi:DNA-binding MarR family transcriptional regulator
VNQRTALSPRRTSVVDTQVIDALVQTSFAVVAVLSQVAAGHDLSLTQLRVLAILQDHRPKISELAQHLGLDRSSVSGLVERGVQRGLLRREESAEDARAVQVRLTRDGHRLAKVLVAEVSDLLAPTIGRLKPVEQQRLSSLLTTLVG